MSLFLSLSLSISLYLSLSLSLCVCVCVRARVFFGVSIFVFERRLVADGLYCLTGSGLTRFFHRPVPALVLPGLGFWSLCVIYVCVRVWAGVRVLWL